MILLTKEQKNKELKENNVSMSRTTALQTEDWFGSGPISR
jgi:hypothetical protein